MRLKSFYGPTMTEAMRLVREALGDDAIIVATRDDEMGGVRVTAAVEESSSPTFPSAVQPPIFQSDIDDSAAIETIASALVQQQVPAALAERLLATATQFASEDPLLALGAALDMHFKYAPLSDEKNAKPVMFVGPPGAGKTLCAAKFATKATIAKKPMAVIGTDTQRAGGMAQLAAFTRVLKTDLLEIEDAHALQDVVSIQPSGTLVFIDTAGCNPFDQKDMQGLENLIKSSGADAVLVLPADMDSSEAIDTAAAFAAIGASRLLPTRLDMTRRVGGLMRIAFETRLPLANFSASGKVTEAPQPMNPVALARLVLPKATAAAQKATGTR